MPLGTTLAADIQAVWDIPPTSISDAANGFAQAYYDYTSGALFGTSLPVLTTAHRDAMAATVFAALSAQVFATSAAAVSAGVTAFWTAVPCAGASGAGNTNGCPGAGAIPAGLLAVGVTFPVTTAIAAAGFAAVLEVATATVTATLTLPPGGPIPYPIT